VLQAVPLRHDAPRGAFLSAVSPVFESFFLFEDRFVCQRRFLLEQRLSAFLGDCFPFFVAAAFFFSPWTSLWQSFIPSPPSSWVWSRHGSCSPYKRRVFPPPPDMIFFGGSFCHPGLPFHQGDVSFAPFVALTKLLSFEVMFFFFFLSSSRLF